jgi:hypothetical protein
MAFDITEPLPYDLSIAPTAILNYELFAEAYDLAINTMPFIVAPTVDNPYRRETAEYRRQQVDQSTEPGEQSLTGWWYRSQSSFHNGAGAKFFEPSQDETLKFRFTDSEGVNVWTKGQVSLLKNVTAVHQTTDAVQHIRSIRYNNTDAVLVRDGYDVDKITAAGTVIHFIDYNSGTEEPVYAICDDGSTAYWVTNKISGGSLKKHVFKKVLTGDSTTADTLMFTNTGNVTNAVMEWCMERVILGADNKLYEITPTDNTNNPTPFFTHKNPSFIFTSITASGVAIYVSGFSGVKSSIYKFTLSTSSGEVTATLNEGVIAAQMPDGEIVQSIKYYLGYMLIGTSKGIRAAVVSDQDGSISYGPLIVETDQPVYDFAFKDRFVWATTSVHGNTGLTRIDLSEQIGASSFYQSLRFAYANDLQVTSSTKTTTACAFIGSTNRMAFTGAVDYVYFEDATTLRPNGYLTTGAIRYATLESKYFKFFKIRGDLSQADVTVASIDSLGTEETLVSVNASIVNTDLGISKPQGGQEFVSFKFTLNRASGDNSVGSVLNGYQIKALPATVKQRIVQYPLYCYDIEMDKFNNITGYDGRAYERIIDLEEIEKSANVVQVKDFRTGEVFQGLIEDVKFSSITPPDQRFSGFGGLLIITLRKFA